MRVQSIPTPEFKQCPTCRVEKPATAFYSRPERWDGLDSQCKDCKRTVFTPNQYFTDAGITTIVLPCLGGKVALATIDTDDRDRVLGFTRWNHLPTKWTAYAGTIAGGVSLHRFVLSAPEGAIVDHINRNGLDCRKANLRLCSTAENSQNRRLDCRSKSGVRGVHWSHDVNKWRVQVSVLGTRHNIGLFENLDDAAAAAREARKRLMPFATN